MTAAAGIYAERVSFPAEAPLATIALVPDGLDPATAASLPTAGGAALDIAERLTPLAGKTVVIVGAAGGIGPS
jgi:NADPH:quinone reductase-like Zn-dependent oxidoreductase